MTKSSATRDFWARYRRLPLEIRDRARVAYGLWRVNPRHPSLCFKKVGELWSVRVGGGYRALAVLEQDTFYWVWIGTHAEYERILASS